MGSLLGCARATEAAEQRADPEWVASDAAADSDGSDAAARAEAEVGETTYADQGGPYGCTTDCSGHEAGYQWANEHEITDPDECGGNSASFIEGCQARAEAYQEALREEGQEQD